MAVFNEVMLFAVCPYTCVHVYLLFFYATEYGEGVISFYPCCQGNRGSSGCQVAKVSVYKHFCVFDITFHPCSTCIHNRCMSPKDRSPLWSQVMCKLGNTLMMGTTGHLCMPWTVRWYEMCAVL